VYGIKFVEEGKFMFAHSEVLRSSVVDDSHCARGEAARRSVSSPSCFLTVPPPNLITPARKNIRTSSNLEDAL